jgi:hypothetical protein
MEAEGTAELVAEDVSEVTWEQTMCEQNARPAGYIQYCTCTDGFSDVFHCHNIDDL